MKTKLYIVSILFIGIAVGGIFFTGDASVAVKSHDGGVYAPSVEQQIFDKTNALRVSKGLPALQHNVVLKNKARSWAMQMTINNKSEHSYAATGNTEPWIILGENVGLVDDADQAMSLMIASPTHYSNLVDPRFTHMEVGVVEIFGEYFFAQEFMQLPVDPPTTVLPETTSTVVVKKAKTCN